MPEEFASIADEMAALLKSEGSNPSPDSSEGAVSAPEPTDQNRAETGETLDAELGTDSPPEVSQGADTNAPPEAPTVSRALLDRVREQYGLDYSGKYKDDEALLEGLVHASRKIGERDEYAQVGQQFVRDPRGIYERLKAQFDPAPQPQQDKPQRPSHIPSSLEEYREWQSMVYRDEEGNLVAKPGAPADLPKRLLKFEQECQQKQFDMYFNPNGYIRQGLGDEFNQEIRRMIAEGVTQYVDKHNEWMAAHEFLKQNEHWLGNAEKGWTPAAMELVQYINEAAQMGIRGYQNQNDYALRRLRLELYDRQKNYPQEQKPAPKNSVNKPNVATPRLKEQDITETRAGESLNDTLTRILNQHPEAVL